ncbi:hypothetical protein B296_00027696 [Ensete ventricosum]|uniref:Uncharacterized protein n=1 Tax=Ensete ventricosum TaxID=4639 RepID=A0A426ZM67_ENSVE|nr:hypothetical protein B296_00027696 [Ensete ventricosum]
MTVCRPGVYYSMIRSHLECNGHSIQSCKSMVWKKTVLVTIRVSVRVVARPGSQLLGINGRDDGSVVLSLVPKEEEGECFQDALARVCRCIGGGAATENADSDSDLEVVADSVTVNLRCPVSENVHFGATLSDELESTDLSQWHLPDGTLCAITDAEGKPFMGNLRYMKQKSPLERHFSSDSGMKSNPKRRPEDNRLPSFETPILGKLEYHCEDIINMSSSATGSYRDGEDPSVNQEVGGPFDLSLNNGHESDSLSLNLDPTYSIENLTPAPLNDPDVILLSDSDEDNLTRISPEIEYGIHPAGNNTISFPNHPGVSEKYSENIGPDTSGTSFLGLFNNTDEFETWPLHACPQSGPGFQLFGTEVPDVLADSHSSLGCAPICGYGLTTNRGVEVTTQVQDLFNCHSDTGMPGSLGDNPPAVANDDRSLKNFLPSQPVGVALQDDLISGTDIGIGINSDDWISLRLAAGGTHGDSTPSNGLTSWQQVTPKETGMDLLNDDGLYLPITNVNYFPR